MPDANATDDTQDQLPDELTMLKDRARIMGIVFSNNIGIDALKKKIEAKMAGETAEPQKDEETEALPAPMVAAAPVRRAQTLREMQIAEHMKLVRLRIANLDPKKASLPGEFITVANEVLGTVRKFVPFGPGTENGFHVPHCIYEFLQGRQFLQITQGRKDSRGHSQVVQRWVPEFALEVLPPLTPKEIADLAAAQAAAGGVD